MNKASKIIIALVVLALLAGAGVILWRASAIGLAQFRSPLQEPSSDSVPARSPLQTPTPERVPSVERPTPLPPIPLPTLRITPTPPATLGNIPAYDSSVPLQAGNIALAAVQSFDIGDSITFKAWSPNGKQFLFGRSVQDYVLVDHGDGVGTHASWHDLWVADADGSNQRKLADIVSSWAWSSGGRYIAYLAPVKEQGIEGKLYIVDTKQWESREIAACDLGYMYDLAWLPTDEIVCRRNGIIYAVKKNDKAMRQVNDIFSSDPMTVSGGTLPPMFQGHYRISPDGKKIAYFIQAQGLWISNIDGSNAVKLDGRLGSPVWSPDSSRLIYTAANGKGRLGTDLWVINADGTNPHSVVVAEGEEAQCLDPTWSPDGRVIAYTYRPNNPFQPESVWVVNADGTVPHLLVDLAFAPQWSPRGNNIAVLRRRASTDDPESLLLLVLLGQ